MNVLDAKASDVNIQLVECEYSFNELNETVEYMTEKLRSNEGLATNLGIDAFGIRTSENRIKVQLRDCSQNCIDQFKAEVLDSPMLDFIPTQGPYDFLATTIQMGNRISSGGYSSSVGYRAKTSAG